MARIGTFSKTLRPQGWFSEHAVPEGWFISDLIGAPSSGSTTLNASAGSFALTGGPATLTYSAGTQVVQNPNTEGSSLPFVEQYGRGGIGGFVEEEPRKRTVYTKHLVVRIPEPPKPKIIPKVLKIEPPKPPPLVHRTLNCDYAEFFNYCEDATLTHVDLDIEELMTIAKRAFAEADIQDYRKEVEANLYND